MDPTSQIVPVDKSYCNAEFASATGSANAVKVSFLILWNRIIYYVSNVVNIDTTGGDLGGNENLFSAISESCHRFLSSLLGHVPVEGRGVESAVN